MKTSLTHPLQIAEVPAAAGAIGITFCPGKQQRSAFSGQWCRDLAIDLDTIRVGETLRRLQSLRFVFCRVALSVGLYQVHDPNSVKVFNLIPCGKVPLVSKLELSTDRCQGCKVLFDFL